MMFGIWFSKEDAEILKGWRDMAVPPSQCWNIFFLLLPPIPYHSIVPQSLKPPAVPQYADA